MTTINLISPTNQGNEYMVRFREPITLKKNSKIYLNFAAFTRLNEIIFSSNQSITFSDLEFQPRTQNNGETAIALNSNVINIPSINPVTGRRGYNVSELENVMRDGFADLIAANPEINIYSAIERLDSNRDQSTFLSGLFLDDDLIKIPFSDFIIDDNHKRDAGDGDDANGDPQVYFKSSATNANPHYDSYALSTTHFFHYASECMGNNKQPISGTLLNVETNVHMSLQQGNITFGLYCKEWADTPTAFTAWAEKTKGNNSTTAGGALNNPGIFTGVNQLASTATAANLKKATIGSLVSFEIELSPDNL